MRLAAESGLGSRKQLYDILAGRGCRTYTLYRIARALDVDLGKLLSVATEGVVWHFSTSPGVVACGADYPNMCSTAIRGSANCLACDEAERGGSVDAPAPATAAI